MPFMPIFGSSMEPTLQSGSLMMIDPVDPKDVKEGDIIVFNVTPMVRDYYNYPPVIAHRVKKVYTERGLTFRTKGDNTGEDPFAVRPEDIRGAVGKQYAYLGFPFLFLQSREGLIFIIVALALLSIFLYSEELNIGRMWVHRGIFSPVIQEGFRSNRVLTEKIEVTEQRMNSTEHALEKFATAISAYAEHLASHTSAIQGLSEASQELKKSSAEQNRVLMHFMEGMGQPGFRAETAEPARPKMEAFEPPKPTKEEVISQLEKTILHLEKKVPEGQASPPGCYRNRQEPPEGDIHQAS